jgi:hypothetical protein
MTRRDIFSLSVTPPNAVGFANGIAQSIVSLARCFGPVLGGYVSNRPNLSRPILTIYHSQISCGLSVYRTTHPGTPLGS